jgi:WD40 repeat protein
MTTVEIKIANINNDNKICEEDIVADNDINKPHNDKHITKIEVSPNEKYLVTYNEEDHSIVGWNVEEKDEVSLKLNQTFKLSDISNKIDHI